MREFSRETNSVLPCFLYEYEYNSYMQKPQFNVEKAQVEKLKDREWRINNLYKIVNEDGDLITFRMNRIQRQIYREIKEAAQKGRHINILKYRQG